MKTSPYLIDESASGEPLRQVDPNSSHYQESWLQELLRNHPGILPVAEIEPVFHPLIPIGKEVTTGVGSIDNLFISPQGYPVLVETKLWRNPDARRDVLAQAIDYASSITGWTFNNVDDVTRKYTAQYEGETMGLLDWIERYTHEPLEVDSAYFEETVSKNLRLGRLLILLVGDRIRSTLVDMLGYINKYPQLAMNVALVELRCFWVNEGKEWPLLVVPSIYAQTEIVERSIVQVNVSADGRYQVTAEQEKRGDQGTSGRIRLTEDEYWERLRHQAPESYEPARQLIEYYRDRDGVDQYPGDSSISLRMVVPESGKRISLFYIRTDGLIYCWVREIQGQLERRGFDLGLLEELKKDLFPILRQRTKSLSIYAPAKDVDIDLFKEAIDRFIDQVRQAASELEE